MNRAFIALVGVYMLAELVDDEKLRQALESMPNLPQWSEVRDFVDREVSRRKNLVNDATQQNADSKDAA